MRQHKPVCLNIGKPFACMVCLRTEFSTSTESWQGRFSRCQCACWCRVLCLQAVCFQWPLQFHSRCQEWSIPKLDQKKKMKIYLQPVML
jgi:hypothetical protein